MDVLHELVNVRKVRKPYTLVVRQSPVHESKSKIAPPILSIQNYMNLLYR